jgi:4'-phosphopantetheinyl transferase
MTTPRATPLEPLAAGVVDVWRASLEVSAEILAALEATLADDEVARARRRVTGELRGHAIASRGLLRAILAHYLPDTPRALAFATAAHGKPYLASANPLDLRFNVTHCRGMALVAVAVGRDVGIDLEAARAIDGLEALARRTFSPRETRALLALPAAQRDAAFLRCWTRKEAFLKLAGFGLSVPLDAFDVSLAPGDPPAVLGLRRPFGQPDAWALADVDAPAGYLASLATTAPAIAQRHRSIDELLAV